MDVTSYLSAVASLLDLPPLEVGQQGVFMVQFAEEQKVNVEVVEWPVIRLYRGLSCALHRDAALVYKTLLEWNMRSSGQVLAVDESEALYLVQHLHAEEHSPKELAQVMTAFSGWGAEVQQRLSRLNPQGHAVPEATARGEGAVAESGAKDEEEVPPLFDTRLFA